MPDTTLKSAVITDAGAAVLSLCIRDGAELTLTGIRTGSGTRPTAALTATTVLPGANAMMTVCAADGVDDSIICVGGYMNNNGLSASMRVTCLGVYAKHPDTDADVLFAIVDMFDEPDVIPAGGGITLYEYTVNVHVFVSNVERIVVNVLGGVTYLTINEGDTRYAWRVHRHWAEEIDETTGETTEQAQRRQDAMLAALRRQSSSAFFIWAFAAGEDAKWGIQAGIVRQNMLTTGGSL